jgi:tetratricopeptide (TPR) repeat protein
MKTTDLLLCVNRQFRMWRKRRWVGLLLLLGFAQFLSAQDRAVLNNVAEGNGKYLAGDFAGAKANYEAAITGDATYAPAHTNIALASGRLGELDAALASAQQAVTLVPGDARFVLNLGKVRAMREEYAEAIAAFDTALGIKPQYKQALFNRGWCQDEMAEYDDALADYQQALAVDPRLQCRDARNRGGQGAAIGMGRSGVVVQTGAVRRAHPARPARRADPPRPRTIARR